MAEETLYEVLGVSSAATLEEIKRAYRQRCVEFHPDGLPDHREEIVRFANERMKLITLAWSVLSDPLKRRDYDQTLRRGRPKTAADAALQEEMRRLSRERDGAREEAQRYQAQAQTQGIDEAVLEELRSIRAFQRMQAEMASREANERFNRSNADARRNTPYEDYLEAERRREAERIERAKSPAQQERERAERAERREQWRAESRNALWGFLWRHSAAVRKAELWMGNFRFFRSQHRTLFQLPFRIAGFLIRLLGIAIVVAAGWWIFAFVYNL